jgi:hypothetical protein
MDLAQARQIRAALDERWPLRRKLSVGVEALRAYAHVRWVVSRHDLAGAVAVFRGTTAGEGSSGLAEQLTGVRIGRAVTRSLRVLPTDTRCLMQSLVLLELLSRRGIAAKLVIGVQSGPAFKAHAWLETGGEPLLWNGGPEYERLLEL